MSWQRNYVVLPSGERIRYALLIRPDADVYSVRFKAPVVGRVTRSTGRAKKVDAIESAHRLILEEYGAVAPSSETVTWDVAKERLRHAMEADGKRPKTITGYVETLDKLTALFPLAKGPSDVTDRMAGDFKTKYAKARYSRARKSSEKVQVRQYARKPKSVDDRIRTLKAVFGWFQKLHLVDGNPFEKVAPPELDRHEVKYVRKEDTSAFFKWLEERYPGWRMPRLFFRVKAVTACRLEDICSLRSDQLRDGRLVFTADTTKNRSERYALLPARLYAKLEAYAGPTYVWESYPAELIEANKAKGFPTHRQNPEFEVRRLYLWVLQLMQAYQKDTGRHLSSHDFRRAAFTRAAENGVHPKLAATAFDVTAETMMRYYTATEKRETADEVLGGLADKLVPEETDKEEEE